MSITKILNLSLILAITSLTISCSRLDLAFRFADVYAMNEADKFFDLTSAQSKELKPEVQRVLAEIQKQELPRVADFLDEIDQFIQAQSPTRTQLDAWTLKARGLVQDAMVRFEPLSLSLAKSASDKQQKHFEEESREKIKDLRKDVETPEKAFKKDRKQVLRWIETFVDPNRGQLKDLDVFLKETPQPFEAMIQNRERLLTEFLQTSGEARFEWIRKMHRDPNSFRQPEYKAALSKREEGLKNYLLKLWSTLTPDQKKELSKNLKEKAKELRALAAKS